MPSSSDQTRVGRTLTLGGGAGSSLEGRDIELSVSPKDIRTSPMISARTAQIDGRGTDGSNSLPSSAESTTNREFARRKGMGGQSINHCSIKLRYNFRT